MGTTLITSLPAGDILGIIPYYAAAQDIDPGDKVSIILQQFHTGLI
jgi:hypothetical protein